MRRRSSGGIEFELQKQSHDRVLREKDCNRGALSAACFHVLDNPHRKSLVAHPRDWPHLGAMVHGYPFLNPLSGDFWPLEIVVGYEWIDKARGLAVGAYYRGRRLKSQFSSMTSVFPGASSVFPKVVAGRHPDEALHGEEMPIRE